MGSAFSGWQNHPVPCPNIPSRSPRHPPLRPARKSPNIRLPVRGGCAQFASPCIARTTTPAAPSLLQAACAECPALEVSQPVLVRAHLPTHSAPAAHTHGNESEVPPEGNRRHSSLPHSNPPSDETSNTAIPRLAAPRPRAHRMCSNLRRASAAGNPRKAEQ